MVFRTAGALAAVLSNFSGQALAQCYPPPQAYPRPPVSPTVTADELSPLNAPVVQGDSLPPVGVGPAYQRMPGGRYQPGTGGYPADPGPLPPWQPGLRECSVARLRDLAAVCSGCFA
jgi:hypothetical protein